MMIYGIDVTGHSGEGPNDSIVNCCRTEHSAPDDSGPDFIVFWRILEQPRSLYLCDVPYEDLV